MNRALRVLLVEDSNDDALLLVEHLRDAGYEPGWARVETPEAMADALDREEWDVVLADYNLPRFSGPEALALLHQTGRDLPFLLVSGAVGEEAAVAAMRAGAHDYIPKGNLARLVPAIEREMGDAADRRRRREAEAGREHAFRELEAERARLQAILETLPVGVFISDAEGRITQANDIGCRIWGGTSPVSQRIEEFADCRAWRTDTRETVAADEWAGVRALCKGETVLGEALDILRFDGECATILNSAAPLRDSGGRIAGTVSVIQDISAQRQAEMLLRRREREFRTLAENSPDIIARFDRNLRHLYISPSILQATGRSQEEFIGWSNTEMGMPVEHAALWEGAIRHVFATGGKASFEFTFQAPDELRHFHAVLVPEFGPGGSVETVLNLSRDVTEWKRAEERHRYLASFPEKNPNPVVETDIQGNVTYANPAAEAALPDLMAAGPRHAFIAGIEELAAQFRAGTTTPATREVCCAETVFEQSIRYLPESQTIRIYSVDITERRRTEDALRESEARERDRAAEAEDANRAKDQFVALVSHELRNPLSAIQAGVGLMQKMLVEDCRSTRALEIIERNARLQARLVNDLLDLSRLQQGKMQLQRAPVDVAKVVSAAEEASSADASEAGLALSCEAEPGLWVHGDFDRLQQVVMNLLSNAIKFTPGGGSVTVRSAKWGVRSEAGIVGSGAAAEDLWETGAAAPPPHPPPGTSHFARIAIQDTGMGIDRDQLAGMFEMFQQGEVGAQRRAGLGLGLALVKGIVERHGGRVWAESAGPGRGSRFVVDLPLVPAPAGMGGNVRTAAGERRICVLLVEDNADTRTLIADTLTLAGYQVQTAGSGEEALEALGEGRPDMLLCDIGLPGMDGFEFLRLARAMPGMADVPAFAVTGYGAEEDVRRGRDAGFTGHFVKPIDVNALDQRIREWLGVRE